mgnify:CR=1 FL=1
MGLFGACIRVGQALVETPVRLGVGAARDAVMIMADDSYEFRGVRSAAKRAEDLLDQAVEEARK